MKKFKKVPKPKPLMVGSPGDRAPIARITSGNAIEVSYPVLPYPDQIRRLKKWLTQASNYLMYIESKGLR